MGVLRKSSFPENLETYNVLVTDTLETSRYFTITDLPDTFSGGKNSFLIQGSEELVPDTVVKVEIKDAKGNIIYTEPGEGIPEYYEGISKPVAVYVYPDTAYGPCTITILGELGKYEDNGILKDIPPQWRDKYNVRWQKTVLVNPNLPNASKIRFYRRPKAEVTETILPVYTRSIVRETISGSLSGVAVSPTQNSNFRNYKGDTIYELYATASIFSSSMEGETIYVTGLNQSYASVIRDVVNDKKLLAYTPYYETSSNLPTSNQIVKNFSDGPFQLSYNKSISFVESSVNTSYAKIKLTDLEAFSGDPARLKIFAKRKADIGNYTLLEDIQLESKEILSADFYSGSVAVDVGLLSSQTIINDFWLYSNFSRDTFYTKTFDNFSLASSVKLEEDGFKNDTNYPKRLFYYSQSLDFTKETEYQLDFSILLSSSLFTPNKVEVYLSGSAFFNPLSGNSLGKKITTLETNSTTKKYDLQQVNFKPESTGDGKLIFAIYQGNWHISNIGLRASQETNFSPNEITLNISLPTVVNNDEYEFKFEFYDINNNYVPVVVTKDYTFVGGSNLSNVNVSASFLSVSPNTNVFPFGYNNNYDFNEVNTFASTPIGTRQITFTVQKPGLTGNVTFTSAAFDSGGVYIDPTNYSSLSLPYPGFLSDITTDFPYLSVDNFTGSISNIEVKRIEYTASLAGYEDRISIFKVVEGTPGSDGTSGSNATQYVIRPLNGTAIKNSDPNTYIELQLTKIDGTTITDLSSGNVKLVTGSLNTIITDGNGITAGTTYTTPYNSKFYASKINGSLVVGAYDFDNSKLVDTITIADITDGLTTGFIEATNGLILKRNAGLNTYTPPSSSLTASFYDGLGKLYTSSLLISASYAAPNDRMIYIVGITDPNITLNYVKADDGTNMSNNTFANTKSANVKYTFIDPYTNQSISATETIALAVDGTSGFNAVNMIMTPIAQTVRKNVTLNSYGAVVPVYIQLFETGSALTYTTSTTPSSGQFTIQLNTANGTNNSVNGTKSGSITPPSVNSDNGSSSSFAFRYRDSNNNLSDFISASHYVTVVSDGSDGTNTGTIGQPSIEIRIVPQTQTVTRNPANVFGIPSPYIVRLYESGSLMTYTNSDPPGGIGQWTLSIIPTEGTLSYTNGATSASIQPPTPTTSTPYGLSSSFAVKYKNSNGVVSEYISQSHQVAVSFDGTNGPGVVFTGIWQNARAYQFSSGSDGRRDVVLWSRTGVEPYNSYYATLRQHTADSSITSTGNGAPNYSTGSVGSAWQELGQESFFVAAKISIFEESFVKNTINIGSSNNGGVSSANITLAGSGSYPYISLGQSDSTGSQGYGLNGIFIGAVKDTLDSNKRKYRMSLVTGSNWLKWDGDGRLLISGTISASEGRIGGVTISGNSIYAGAGNYGQADTGFYLTSASTNIFSLGNKLTWNGSTLSVNGTINITNPSTANNGGPVGSFSNGDSLTAGSIGGVTIGSTKIYIGTGNWRNTDTSFYVDNTGKFSLEDRLSWDPTNNYLNVSGTIFAETGSIGGVTIGANKIYTGTGTWGNKNTGFYVDNTGQFSLKDALTWNGSLLYVSGTVSASAGAIGGVQIDKSRLYLGDGIFSGSTTPFFVSSSGRFSLGEVVSYEPLTRLLKISGTLAADTIDAVQIKDINFGDAKGVNFASGTIGGWILADQKLVSTNTSMSLNANDASIRIGSGSSGTDVTTIVIRSGNPSGLTGTTKTFSSISDHSTVAFNTSYSGSTNITSAGSYVTITIASGEEGTYTGTITHAATLASPAAANNSLINLIGFAGYVKCWLDLVIAKNTGFGIDDVVGRYTIGEALSSPSVPTTTGLNPILFVPNTSTNISINFTQAMNYHARLEWRLITLSGLGTVTINERTSDITNTSNNLVLTQEVSFTEITDGALQVVRSSTRYVKMTRTGTSNTMLEVGGDITATGNITAYYSDIRLKNILGTIDNPLYKIQKLNGVYFMENELAKKFGYNNEKQQVGLIAQEVKEVLPEVIVPAPFDIDNGGNSKTGENYITIQYEKVIPLLVEAIKELKKEIEKLKNR